MVDTPASEDASLILAKTLPETGRASRPRGFGSDFTPFEEEVHG